MRVFLLDRRYGGEDSYQLSNKERMYLNKVLRLEIGTGFTAKDSSERYYRAVLIDEDLISLEITDAPEETLLDSLSSYKGPFMPIDLYMSVLKGKKNEAVIRQATEIGVRRIILMDTEFTEKNTMNSHQRERLDTIAREAVQQSGGKLPAITGPMAFADAIRSTEGRAIILHQSRRQRTLTLQEALDGLSIDDQVSVLIGPEGGFSDDECILAEENGIQPVLLNTNILRAETASIYAVSAIQAIIQN